ncbi:MAG TPA: TonB family protein [Candidatus Acidoferrales bacterium]|nr:TonB family protein [Candidatus Acidoferrales bacterium]
MQRGLARWYICAATAAALHGSLLAFLLSWRLPNPSPVDIIRLSLSHGGEHGGLSASAPAAVAEEAPPPPAPIAKKENPPKVHRLDPSAKHVAKHSAPVAIAAVPSRPTLDASTTDRPGSDASSASALPSSGSSPAGGGGGAGEGGAGGGNGTGGDGEAVEGRAYCEYCPEPGYPMVARRRGWKGVVDVQLVLLADGRVDSASIMHSSGYEVLDKEAVDVARRSRFRLPHRESSAPLRGHIEYRFELLP